MYKGCAFEMVETPLRREKHTDVTSVGSNPTATTTTQNIMFGISHTKNSKNKYGYTEICIPYISLIERKYLSQDYRRVFSKYDTRSIEQVEHSMRSHLWNAYWYLFCHNHNGRKRKQALRKMFKYWYGCPDAWGEYTEDFLKYDLLCPFPMYATDEIRAKNGDVVTCPKIKDVLLHNSRALTKRQLSKIS